MALYCTISNFENIASPSLPLRITLSQSYLCSESDASINRSQGLLSSFVSMVNMDIYLCLNTYSLVHRRSNETVSCWSLGHKIRLSRKSFVYLFWMLACWHGAYTHVWWICCKQVTEVWSEAATNKSRRCCCLFLGARGSKDNNNAQIEKVSCGRTLCLSPSKTNKTGWFDNGLNTERDFQKSSSYLLILILTSFSEQSNFCFTCICSHISHQSWWTKAYSK